MTRALKDGMVIKGTGIIVINPDGEYLLIRRKDTDELGLPGGGFEGNETAIQCAKRELFEEVGIDVNINDLQYIGACDSPPNPHKAKGDSVHGLSLNYVVKLKEPQEVKIQESEVKSHQWTNVYDLDGMLRADEDWFYPSSVETLKHFKQLNGGNF